MDWWLYIGGGIFWEFFVLMIAVGILEKPKDLVKEDPSKDIKLVSKIHSILCGIFMFAGLCIWIYWCGRMANG